MQTIELPSCSHSICALEKFVGSIASKYKVNNDIYPNILISLTEAVNNAIIHGNKQDESKLVVITHNMTKRILAFVVSDQGSGFNPSSVPDPTAPENLDCCGGRGVFLMRQLADDVKYHNNGSSVEICFKLWQQKIQKSTFFLKM